MPKYEIKNVAVSVYDRRDLRRIIADEAGLNEKDIIDFAIQRRSLDLRKKETDIVYIYTLMFETKQEVKRKAVVLVQEEKPITFSRRKRQMRPVIVGAGPAGLFCAYTFLLQGVAPIVLERGQRIQKRVADVAEFEKSRMFDADSNVCFGEGGAGAFSDGKLTSRSKDNLRQRFVFETLVKFGANASICYDNRPHLGTDGFRRIVETMTNALIKMGATFHFGVRLDEMDVINGRVCAAIAGDKAFTTDAVVLACGHSARDTVEMLHARGCAMEVKPFAVGVRVEHRREDIDRMTYGRHYGKAALPAAEYIMRHQTRDGRGVYTFCNCPGGVVVPCVTEAQQMCVNGMSYAARDAQNTNSAVVVSVNQKDFGNMTPLGGIAYQRRLERQAFISGGGAYRAPVMLLGEFLNTTEAKGFGEVTPTCASGVEYADIRPCFTPDIVQALQQGFAAFGRKMQGFDSARAMLTAVESRTSSAVRILRDERHESLNLRGVYLAGEGSGYAGGIVSSAIDGMKTAEHICAGIRKD